MALPYLAAAYLAQGAFKEPMEALFLLAFALLLSGATTVRRALPLAVIAAGAVYAYSFPGLFWLLGAAAVYVLVALIKGWRPVASSLGARRAWAAAAVAGALVLLVAPELGRLIDFTDFRAFRDSTISSGLGNLRHQLSPLEALGIWPASDFRLSASAATTPAPAFYLGALVAALALVVGMPRWIGRHGWAVPAALAAAVVIYLGALAFGTVYTSAKALAIAAPLITLISLGGLLARERSGPTDGRLAPDRGAQIDHGRSLGAHSPPLWRGALALALAAGMALSSFPVLRQAPVAPRDHAEQLAELRPLVQGHEVLFLGRDNFVAYELRGSRPFTAVRNYYDPNYVRPNLRLDDVFRKFDFDSVRPATLGRFPYVITTRAAYASGPPPAFEPLRLTADFALWKRTGPVGERRTLAEGDRPGEPLDCSTRRGRRLSRGGGAATAFAAPPAIGGAWSPSPTVESGSASSQAADAAARSLADLDPVRLHQGASDPRAGHGRDPAGEPRLSRLGSLPCRGRAHRPAPRPGSIHGQRRATAARGPPAGRVLGGPSGDDRRLARRRRSIRWAASRPGRAPRPAAASLRPLRGLVPPAGRALKRL